MSSLCVIVILGSNSWCRNDQSIITVRHGDGDHRVRVHRVRSGGGSTVIVDAATTERVRKLRRMKFSVAGIARQTGLSEADVARILQERHLLAQIERVAAKSGSARG